jgi:hypothetical protein
LLKLVQAMKLPEDTRWGALSPARLQALAGQMTASRFKIESRAMNKAEWVASGGVPTGELDPSSMESRLRKGLHMAGEMLDIDGIPGGYNMHAAWASAWIAGTAIAAACRE